MKNTLKNILSILLCTSLLFTISCSSDDEVSGPTYEFIDQNAQGTIDGVAFNFGEGTAEDGNDEELSIRFYNSSETFTDVCDFFGFGESVSVFFGIPNAVGLYELSFNLDSFEGRTVTLFNPENVLNIIATEGAVEILTITSTEVTGRIDARGSDGDQVNGNFTVVFCP